MVKWLSYLMKCNCFFFWSLYDGKSGKIEKNRENLTRKSIHPSIYWRKGTINSIGQLKFHMSSKGQREDTVCVCEHRMTASIEREKEQNCGSNINCKLYGACHKAQELFFFIPLNSMLFYPFLVSNLHNNNNCVFVVCDITNITCSYKCIYVYVCI